MANPIRLEQGLAVLLGVTGGALLVTYGSLAHNGIAFTIGLITLAGSLGLPFLLTCKMIHELWQKNQDKLEKNFQDKMLAFTLGKFSFWGSQSKNAL